MKRKREDLAHAIVGYASRLTVEGVSKLIRGAQLEAMNEVLDHQLNAMRCIRTSDFDEIDLDALLDAEEGGRD